MKALVLHMAHFRLPDDFSGTLSDALRILADYHDSMSGKPEQSLEPLSEELGNMTLKESSAELFDKFLDSVRQGRRFAGVLQVVSYDPSFPLEDL